MAVKKTSKAKVAKKKAPQVTYSSGGSAISNRHRNFLAILVLFAGFSLYTITSFMNSNNEYIKKMYTDVLSSDQSSVEDIQVQKENPFKDLPSSHPAYQAVIQLYYQGVVGGYPDNTFRPDNKVNSAEFAKILAEASDVDYDCF